MSRKEPVDPAARPSLLIAGNRLDQVLSVALIAGWVVATIFRQLGHWAPDLSALYMAGHFFEMQAQGLIYAAPPHFFGGSPAEWSAEMVRLGVGGNDVYPYIYPPLWAALAAPFTKWLTIQQFFDAAIVVQTTLIGLSAFLAARLLRPAAMPMVLWAGASVLLLESSTYAYAALYFNQPQITIIFLTLLAFERLVRGRERSAGAALALATAIKIAPVVYVSILVYQRRWRAILAFVVTGLGLGLAGLALAGPGLHLDFLHALGRMKGTLLVSATNASLQDLVFVFGVKSGAFPPADVSSNAIVTLPLLSAIGWGLRVVFAAGLVLLALGLRKRTPADQLAVGLFALSLMVPLFGPVGWLHYYLLPLLLLPGIVAILPRWLAVVAVLAFALPASLWSFTTLQSIPVVGMSYTLAAMTVPPLFLLICLGLAVLWGARSAPATLRR